jgi:hypothetical protein
MMKRDKSMAAVQMKMDLNAALKPFDYPEEPDSGMKWFGYAESATRKKEGPSVPKRANRDIKFVD